MVLLAAAISMSIAGCSLFDSAPVREKVVQHPAAKTADPYQIGSDDELEIVVWNQPQLSGKVIVASDGTIAMPLIGRVPAAGQTPDAAQGGPREALCSLRSWRECHGAGERSGQPRILRDWRGKQTGSIQAAFG